MRVLSMAPLIHIHLLLKTLQHVSVHVPPGSEPGTDAVVVVVALQHGFEEAA